MFEPINLKAYTCLYCNKTTTDKQSLKQCQNRHIFHLSCLKSATKTKTICPICHPETPSTLIRMKNRCVKELGKIIEDAFDGTAGIVLAQALGFVFGRPRIPNLLVFNIQLIVACKFIKTLHEMNENKLLKQFCYSTIATYMFRGSILGDAALKSLIHIGALGIGVGLISRHIFKLEF